MSPRSGAASWRALLAGAASLIAFATHSFADGETVADVFRSRAPSVVRVQAALQSDNTSGRAATRLICSGVFISKTGRVLTFAGEHNEMARASRIWIERDGMPFLADLIGSDPQAKIALLQVVKLPAAFEAVNVEPLEERLPVGSPVVAVTAPLSIDEPSPSTGIIAGYESNFGENVFPFSYARVTIPSGDAESGSPVFDLQSRLVGISVASLPQFSSSYLVPTRALARLVEDFGAHGRATYSDLPIECDEYTDSANLTRQVMVSKIQPESAASRAGLRVGDVIRRIDGVNIRRLHDFRDALFYSRIGQYLQFEIERDGRIIPFVLPVEAQPQPAVPITAPPPLISTPPQPGSAPPSGNP